MMKHIVVVVFVIAMGAPLAVPLGAQWLDYPTAGVPKTPAGKPNLQAPAPRTADGKPDLSGIWDNRRGSTPLAPVEGIFPLGANSEGWVDFGAGLPGGLPYQPWAAEAVKKRKVDYGKDDPPTHCMPLGTPRMLVDPLYRKFVQ